MVQAPTTSITNVNGHARHDHSSMMRLPGGQSLTASYLCLTGIDLLGVRYVGRALPYRSVALASFVSLSIGHNIGFSARSTGAIRYRFYSRWGLSAGEVARVILFSGTTVGLGLIILGGIALLVQPHLAEQVTQLDRGLIRGLGTGCLALAICYLGLAALVRRPLRLGRWLLRVPSLALAIGQVVIGPLNFACVAACLHQALAASAQEQTKDSSVPGSASHASFAPAIPGRR